jgi:hypothetical protein
MTSCCHIFALAIGILAILCAVVGVAAPWTVAAADVSTANVQGGTTTIDQQVVLLTLWRRYEKHTQRKDNSQSWSAYFSGRGGRQYCPEDRDKTYQGAWNRIQAAEAFSIITVAFAVIHVAICGAYASGHLRHRAWYCLSALLTMMAAAAAIAAWFFYLNYCDKAYCDEYIRENTGEADGIDFSDLFQSGSQQITDDAYCYSYIGFGFEVVVMGLILITAILMCFGGARRRHHDVHVVSVPPSQPVVAQHTVTEHVDAAPAHHHSAAPYAYE